MAHPSFSRLRDVLGVALGLLLSVGCGQQGASPDATTVEDSQEAAIARTRPRVKLSAGTRHSLAIRTNGTVWASGANHSSQLGRTGFTSTSTPLQVPGVTNATSVAAGDESSVALLSAGTVWTWGANQTGQLGVPTGSTPGAVRAAPGQVPAVGGRHKHRTVDASPGDRADERRGPVRGPDACVGRQIGYHRLDLGNAPGCAIPSRPRSARAHSGVWPDGMCRCRRWQGHLLRHQVERHAVELGLQHRG
ncbi:RCC1 domain-containing protein [Corallococcus terminator]